jgi:hypothetical protein
VRVDIAPVDDIQIHQPGQRLQQPDSVPAAEDHDSVGRQTRTGTCGTCVARSILVRAGNPHKLSKLPLYQRPKNGAGDGNRNRMTSLEGIGCSGPELHIRRQDGVFDCP